METLSKHSETEILLQIANDMLRVESELEGFASSLKPGGNAAQEKYEQLKSEFHRQVAELRYSTNRLSPEDLDGVHSALFQLEILLSAKVQGKDELISQKSLILELLRKLESGLTRKYEGIIHNDSFQHAMEKFRLKLEILRLRLVVGKFEFSDAYRQGMKDASHHIHSAVRQIEGRVGIRDSSIRQKIRRAYRKMKKAVKNIKA